MERRALDRRHGRDGADRALRDGQGVVARRRELRAAHGLPAPAVHRPGRLRDLWRAPRRLDDARSAAHLRGELLERPPGGAPGVTVAAASELTRTFGGVRVPVAAR